MGYGYNSYPYWRIYCEDHSELLVKQKMRRFGESTYNRLLKFCRVINRQADLHEDKVQDLCSKDSPYRRLYLKSLHKTKGEVSPAEPDERTQKVIDAFLSSFYEHNNLNSSERFTIILNRDPNGGFEVSDVVIPQEKPHEPQEDEPMLGKRKPLISSSAKRKGKGKANKKNLPST